MAIAGFILALLALLFCWLPPLALPLSLTAIIFSGLRIAGGRAARQRGDSEALPIAALILGLIALLPSLLLIFLLSLIANFADAPHPSEEGDFTTL